MEKKIIKVVKNSKFGGFGLSCLGLSRFAELKGKKAYFFKVDFKNDRKYIPLTLEEAEKELMIFVYSVPNPQDYKLSERDADGLYKSANKRAEEIKIEPEDRADPDLVKVVEGLGEKANTRFSKLEIVEIPAGIKWIIDDYDGVETIREEHRTW